MIKIQRPAWTCRFPMVVEFDGSICEVRYVDEPREGVYRCGLVDQNDNHHKVYGQRLVTVLWPSAGDAVRLTGRYIGAREGSFGIVGGVVGRFKDASTITYNYRAYRNHNEKCNRVGEYVSASGGPSPIAQDLSRLRWTGETTDVWFWRHSPAAIHGRNSEEYRLTVPVWEWNGKD